MSSSRIISRFVLRKFASLCDCRDSHYTDCFIVTTYLRQNHIQVKYNRLLSSHLIEDEKVSLFIQYLEEKRIIFSLEDLIELFEFVISPEDKEVNGAVYTPEYIREDIVTRVLSKLEGRLEEKKFADIACGCGGFLITLAKHLYERGISYTRIFADCLYGVDIAEYSITRTRLMLSLLALEEEDVEEYQFNLIHADSLCFEWNKVEEVKNHGGFDAIVGNPPYVGASKIDDDTMALVKKWEVSQSGKADMYIPFFQIGIENLVENGILGYITVNNFYRSVNGRALRKYISQHGYNVYLIDFGAEQIFHGRSTYTCLCFIQKVNNGVLYYTTSDSRNTGELLDCDFTRFCYQQLEDVNGWTLTSGTGLSAIKAIRNIGVALSEYTTIRNGFATLRNDIYLFSPQQEDDKYYYIVKNNKESKIEKGICRTAIKGNILRCEDDLRTYSEKLIFPYKNSKGENGLIPIPEDEMIMDYPSTYNYLTKNKDELGKRSKSDKIKPWYAYGRSQALNTTGYKLIFPYIADNPYFVICEQPEMMFYNGYAIIDESLDNLRFLQKVLSSKLFWYYIKKTSKPYGGNFYALAKNYVKTFGVADITEDEKRRIIAMSQEEADEYIEKLYGVDME